MGYHEKEGENAIVLQNLVKKFEDVIAVDGLDLTVKKGEIFGLLGPNGAGKTTVINILCNLLPATSGSAYVGGYDVKDQNDNVKKLIGLCPQEPAYFSYLTGRENIMFFGELHDVPKKELIERTQDLLEKLGLGANADRKVGKYSGGMVRRINTIIALVHNPEIAFLDEPTVAMDPQSRRAVWDFIKNLKEMGKTIILTTHYIEEAEFLCDRVGIIDHGKLIEIGQPKELMKKHNTENLEEVFINLTGRKIREEV